MFWNISWSAGVEKKEGFESLNVNIYQNKIQIQQASIIQHGMCCLLIININNTDWEGAHASVFICPLIFTMTQISD